MVNMSSAWPSGGEGVYTQWTHKTRENKWKLSLLILKLEKTKNKPIYVNGDGKFWFWWFNSSSSLVSLYPFWLWQTDKNKIKGLGSILSSILRGVWFQVNWMKYFLWLEQSWIFKFWLPIKMRAENLIIAGRFITNWIISFQVLHRNNAPGSAAET